MNQDNVIDARGLSCPEPVILLMKAMKKGGESYTILVDNAAAKENTTRYAESQGYHAAIKEEKGDIELCFTK